MLKKFPHVYVTLFILIIISALLTFIVTPGQYEYQLDDEGQPTRLVEPDSFHQVPRSAIGPWQMMLSIPRGMGEAASIIFFIFIVGGAFSMVTATGAIDSGIRSTVKALHGKDFALIFAVVLLFSLGGATFGMAEEALIFIPMLVALARAMGYDSLTGLAMALVGPCAGFTAGFMNPFTVGVAQDVVGLPMFSGLGYRVIIWAATTLVSFWFIYRYARKVKKNPESSIMYEEDKKRDRVVLEFDAPFTFRQKIVLIVMALTFLVLVYGVIEYGWWIDELSALFLSMGIICGLIGGLMPGKLAEEFVKGATALTIGALVVGIARAILVVLRDGAILHTIVYFLSGLVSGLPLPLTAMGMYIVQIFVSIVIPSGSGMAMVTMPIMGPLSTLLGLTQQLAVLIYHFADGFTNIIIPTSGVLLAGIALADVPYEKWVRWYWPLFLIFIALGAVFIIIGQIIKFGPF